MSALSCRGAKVGPVSKVQGSIRVRCFASPYVNISLVINYTYCGGGIGNQFEYSIYLHAEINCESLLGLHNTVDAPD